MTSIVGYADTFPGGESKKFRLRLFTSKAKNEFFTASNYYLNAERFKRRIVSEESHRKYYCHSE